MARKKPTGDQKIEIKIIEDEGARLACFYKRRRNVFKKATELSILCGAKVGIVAYSPTGKAFCIEHPANSVINGFLADDNGIDSPAPAADTSNIGSASSQDNICKLRQQYEEVSKLVEAEKKWGENAKKVLRRFGLVAPTDDEMCMEKLVEHLRVLEGFSAKLQKLIDHKRASSENCTLNLPMNSTPVVNAREEDEVNLPPLPPSLGGFGSGIGFVASI